MAKNTKAVSTRRKALPKAKQPALISYTLIGGPWHGTKNSLPDTTLAFKCKGFHGRYVKGEWSNV